MTKPEELPITPGEAIKRYDHTHDGMMEHRVGYWVKHVDHNAAVRAMAERLEEARRLLLAIATHSEQAGNDNVRGADLRLSTPSINAFLTRTKQPEE